MKSFAFSNLYLDVSGNDAVREHHDNKLTLCLCLSEQRNEIPLVGLELNMVYLPCSWGIPLVSVDSFVVQNNIHDV